MLFLALVAISLIKTTQCVKAIPGQPVPHAEVLEDLLSKFLGDSYSNNALFDFILGQPSQGRDNLTGENLDISILDVNNVRKVIAFARKKHESGIKAAEESRRKYVPFPQDIAYEWHPYVVNKTVDLMKTTFYMTKEKINQTRPFRKKYSDLVGYKIAVLYGASATILGKMEALYSQMKNFPWKTHFIWFLIIYEKILACNIDIADSIEKIFIIQGDYEAIRGPKDDLMSAGAKGHDHLTDAQLKAMMTNEHSHNQKLTPEQQAALDHHNKKFQTI